ncbi:hypothetical protein ACVIWV_010226 [Bradyrhizobium diazoefficiens]
MDDQAPDPGESDRQQSPDKQRQRTLPGPAQTPTAVLRYRLIRIRPHHLSCVTMLRAPAPGFPPPWSDSDLNARTRFVDPLEAQRLRLGAESDVLRVFHRIVHDRRDNDTADFLLPPVNDASATDRGRHWSLLFVDRSNRQRLSPITTIPMGDTTRRMQDNSQKG